jgi:two-component system response regulator DevR
MRPAMINVLLVEDHRLVFEGLSSLLSEYPDLSVIGNAATVADAVENASSLRPDLVLMDYRLPDGDGAQATEQIRARLPDTAVLFLSADLSEASMIRAVEAGACGYVSKASSAEELVDAIRRAADGEFLLDPATMARLFTQRRQAQRQESERIAIGVDLTTREREVLGLMARGMDNYEVAAELGIGYGTVRGHVRGVLEKLASRSRLQAVAIARQAGLVN